MLLKGREAMRFTAETRGCLKCKISSLLTRNGGRTYGRTLYGRFSQNQNFWDAWNTMGAIHSTKIQTGPTEKRGPPQKVDPFFETFPVGPNRSIEFWTEISGKFG